MQAPNTSPCCHCLGCSIALEKEHMMMLRRSSAAGSTSCKPQSMRNSVCSARLELQECLPVPDRDRMTMELVVAPPEKYLTPRSSSPSDTPVAAKNTWSPEHRSLVVRTCNTIGTAAVLRPLPGIACAHRASNHHQEASHYVYEQPI